MQSSPPERAWQEPSSPANSQYSVDLAALDLDSRSGATTPVPKQEVDRIHSEDIDGPSDFTVNMGKWFNGGTAGRGTTRSMKRLESLRETRDEGVQANGSFLTPSKKQDEERSASHHTPSNSPPPDSVFKIQSMLSVRDEDISAWDPYTDGEESTPEPPAHKHFLQPTVEDYYSELTPARLPSMHRTKSSSSHTHVAGADDVGGQEPSSPGRPSSETLSPVRSPARSPVRSLTLRRSEPRQFSSQSTEAAFEKQMQDLQAKCKQLELLNAALGQAVDEERRMRASEKAEHDERSAKQEREFILMKERSTNERGDHHQDVDGMKAKLDQYDRERDESQRKLNLMQQQYDDDVRKISEDAQREKAEQNAKMRALEQDLELALRNRDEAEESERMVRRELDKHNAELEGKQQDDLDRMESDLTQIEDPDDRIHDLEEQLQDAWAQVSKAQASKREAEQETSDARAELAGLQQSHMEATHVATDHHRAVAVAEDLQTQVKKLLEQLHNEQTTHKAELDRIRNDTSHAPAQPSTKDEEVLRTKLEAKLTELNTAILERDALRDDLEAQQSTLNAAILERDDAQDALVTAQMALQDAKDALTDQAAVSAAIDGEVSAAIAKREAYWRERLDSSEKERKVMVKALLRQWGREEVGVTQEQLDGRQGYQYQFAKERRGSALDAQAGT